MTNDTIHFITNEFSRGISQNEEWWKYRLSLYKHFTLNSIINQTNKNFYLLMTIDDRFRNTHYEDIVSILNDSGLKYFVIDRTKKDDLRKVLEPIIKDFDYVYTTRIDTDDVFRNDVVEEIQKHNYEYKQALFYQKGYCYDIDNKKLQHYYAQFPPFATLMFPKEVFLDDDKRNEYIGVQSHDILIRTFKPIYLQENKYIVIIHKNNLASVYLEGNEARFRQRFEIQSSEHDRILKEFGFDSKTYEKYFR